MRSQQHSGPSEPLLSTVRSVDTPLGPGRFHLDLAAEPRAALVLGHGAGGGVGAFDLELLARRLPPLGITVVRFEQPWRTAGRKVAVAPSRLDEGWRAALDQLLRWPGFPPRLVIGGRSAGARVACRTAPDFDVAAVICLAFPLHLPGQPLKSRVAELLRPTAPRLVLQGTNDSFGGSAEIRSAIGEAEGISIVELPGADHSFRVAKAALFTAAALRASIVAEAAAFILPDETDPRDGRL